MLYGSDYPFLTLERWLKAFRRHEPSPEVEEKVLRTNAARLLAIAVD